MNFNPDMHIHLWGFILIVFIADIISKGLRRAIQRVKRARQPNIH